MNIRHAAAQPSPTVVVGSNTGGRDRLYTGYVSSLPLEVLPVDAVCFAAHATDFDPADVGSRRDSPSDFCGSIITMEAMKDGAALMPGRRFMEAFREAHPALCFKRQFYFVSLI